MKDQPFDSADRSHQRQASHCSRLGVHTKRQHGGRINKKRTSSRIDRHKKHAEQQHPSYMQVDARILQRKESEIKEQENQRSGNIKRPNPQAGMTYDRIDEEEP
jgi:hypothetical protein